MDLPEHLNSATPERTIPSLEAPVAIPKGLNIENGGGGGRGDSLLSPISAMSVATDKPSSWRTWEVPRISPNFQLRPLTPPMFGEQGLSRRPINCQRRSLQEMRELEPDDDP